MESAIFGLVGVALGALLTVVREWWFQSRKNKKDAEYLAILVSCELERYALCCAEVVGDDGLYQGRPDERGYSSIQVEAPKFETHGFGVEWKSLPAHLMYEVLDFPYKAELAGNSVSAAFECAATPPDFSEGFEERQLQYASLGLSALKLAAKLRDYVGLAPRDIGEWNPAEYMERHRADIESLRKERTSQFVTTDV
ncbi:MAG: hypothetical protein RLY71_4381 [Pseudomonadota bacterium]|jgi:hypothetical protein